MKYIKQFLIIMAVSFAGELLKMCLPLPVPASIYGMILMFAALMTGVIKLDHVKETAHFLVEIMPIMFIPAAVGLITSVDALKPFLIPVVIITVVTLITVLAATGWVSQLITRKTGKKDGEKYE